MTDSSIARITGMFGVACVFRRSHGLSSLCGSSALPRPAMTARRWRGLWPESDWLGHLALVSAAVWLAVTLAADGLMGGAVLATLQGTSDVSAALPLVFGTLLIYNGSIAFAITGLFMVAAGWATLDSGVLPRWTGWIAWISALLCALSIRRCSRAQQTHRGSTTR